MKILANKMRFPCRETAAAIRDIPLARPICGSDDKEFQVAKKGPDGKPIYKLVKKGPNAGTMKMETIKCTLMLRMVELHGITYRTCGRSSRIIAKSKLGERKLTPADFYRTLQRCCEPDLAKRALLHLLISDELLALNPLRA